MIGIFVPGFSIWRPTSSPDGAGGHTRAMAKLADVSGRLTPLSGMLAIMAQQERSSLTHRFSCPSTTDIQVGDEVRKGGQSVRVEAVRTTSTGRRKECNCSEVLP